MRRLAWEVAGRRSVAGTLAGVSLLKRNRDVAVVATVAVIIRVGFWAYTGRLWEDALTTVTHARNAIEGLGLTHHPGEPPTHGFTSALSVLIPLAGEAIARDGGFVALRIASLIGVVVAIVAADAIGRRLGLERWARLFILGYLAVDANHVFYGMSGMETQVAVAALLVSAWAFLAGHRAAGIALGLALLARPDFLIWAAIVVAMVVWRQRQALVPLVAGAALITAPWLAFTTLYYGSPVPQTIVAKSLAFTSFPVDRSIGGWIAWAPEQLMSRASPIGRTFMPFLEDTLAFGAPVPIVLLVVISTTMALLALLGAWARRNEPNWTPFVLFVVVDLGYRIVFLPREYHDWYVPPFTAITIFLVAAGLQRLAQDRPFRASNRAAVVAAVLVACFAIPLPWVFQVERAIQVEINEGVRVPLGLALAELVGPGEAVAAEAPGYLGYLARVKILDYPGLTSRESLAVVRSLPQERRSLESLIDELRPEWIVLRPIERFYFEQNYPETLALYQEVRRVGAPRDEIGWNNYRKWTVDGEFVIMRLAS